ncbi:sel1 repeat family protein [Pelomyxa schiedti]|nr:sel1 repeat family protein [Pelomyxa schiedti]
MYDLANCYLEGSNGVARDRGQGAALMQRAADAGNAAAMLALAWAHYRPPPPPPPGGRVLWARDLDAAQRWFTMARSGAGLYNVGCDYYYAGAGVERDADKAVALWAKAADLGEELAIVQLGWCYQHGVGVQRNPKKAVKLYNDAIGLDDCHSWRLGVCYLRGEGVKRNVTMAVKLFRSITDANAQAYLGWCYLWGGGGIERDVAKAVALLRSSVSVRGRKEVFLGYCHETGVGVDQDTAKAQELYNAGKHTPEGAEALGELGVFCQRGDCGAPVDKRMAIGYFRMGAESGDPISMFHLGACLKDGNGVDCDLEQSRHWLGKATQLGHKGEVMSQAIPKKKGVIDALQKEVESLQMEVKKKNEQLLRSERTQEDTAKINLEMSSIKEKLPESFPENYEDTVNTMTALIPATADDFRVEKLLGTGSNSVAFEVCYLPRSAISPNQTGKNMVMKVVFNWENTPRQSFLRQKYMAECVILSLVPPHPNVIHPLGTLVLPCLTNAFVEKIPTDQPYFRELCSNKSLAILMPHCGITLPSFLSSLSMEDKKTVEVVHNLLLQGLKAIVHIESQSIVHRDIKEDNILVDPESGDLTLIDFGEAVHCLNTNLEMAISSITQPWGNAGTIPPDLSIFLRSMRSGTSGVFSYSKCDSFALALTFWDALLPPTNKFIGTLDCDTSAFTTQALCTEFPLNQLLSSEQQGRLLETVMIGMMEPDKAKRLSASDAISRLQGATTSMLQGAATSGLQGSPPTIQSLLSTVTNYTVETLLGTGASSAVFKVQNCTTTSSSGKLSSPSTTAVVKSYVVMKVLFNWDDTSQTMLKQKYMHECQILSFVPHHTNVIHTLGDLVVPWYVI